MSARRRQGGRGAAGILVGLVAATGVLAAATSTGAEHLAESPPLVIAVTDPAAGVVVAPDAPPVPGYDRDRLFGGWARTGYWCDTRDRALARDLTDQTVRDGCDVQAGTLHDPYSGAVVIGPTRALDVDHLVPEALAYRSGAARWTDVQRRAYTNDLDLLRTTTAAANRSKRDDGPERWLPAVGRCDYVRAFGAVLRKYALTATAERVAAMRRACSR